MSRSIQAATGIGLASEGRTREKVAPRLRFGLVWTAGVLFWTLVGPAGTTATERLPAPSASCHRRNSPRLAADGTSAPAPPRLAADGTSAPAPSRPGHNPEPHSLRGNPALTRSRPREGSERRLTCRCGSSQRGESTCG